MRNRGRAPSRSGDGRKDNYKDVEKCLRNHKLSHHGQHCEINRTTNKTGECERCGACSPPREGKEERLDLLGGLVARRVPINLCTVAAAAEAARLALTSPA